MKYEEVYLHGYRTVREAQKGLGRYFHFYSMERLHEAELDYLTMLEVYFGIKSVKIFASEPIV